ncbi:MAG: hypothetical protein JWQ42_1563 [Edaphobacter sp.]|nr:hypothetical protein [Edaphobacter sp.]
MTSRADNPSRTNSFLSSNRFNALSKAATSLFTVLDKGSPHQKSKIVRLGLLRQPIAFRKAIAIPLCDPKYGFFCKWSILAIIFVYARLAPICDSPHLMAICSCCCLSRRIPIRQMMLGRNIPHSELRDESYPTDQQTSAYDSPDIS